MMEVIPAATQDMPSYISGLSRVTEKYAMRVKCTFVAYGKQLFLITSSHFSFMEMEMYHMMDPDWSVQTKLSSKWTSQTFSPTNINAAENSMKRAYNINKQKNSKPLVLYCIAIRNA